MVALGDKPPPLLDFITTAQKNIENWYQEPGFYSDKSDHAVHYSFEIHLCGEYEIV